MCTGLCTIAPSSGVTMYTRAPLGEGVRAAAAGAAAGAGSAKAVVAISANARNVASRPRVEVVIGIPPSDRECSKQGAYGKDDGRADDVGEEQEHVLEQ